MTKRDLLKQPFTEEELSEWILTDDEVKELKETTLDEFYTTSALGSMASWGTTRIGLLMGELGLDLSNDWMKFVIYSNKLSNEGDAYGDFEESKEYKKFEDKELKPFVEKRLQEQIKKDLVHYQYPDIFKDGKYRRNVSIKDTPKDGRETSILEIGIFNSRIPKERNDELLWGVLPETVCCTSMYKNGVCKPACVCSQCQKTYKNYKAWEKKQ